MCAKSLPPTPLAPKAHTDQFPQSCCSKLGVGWGAAIAAPSTKPQATLTRCFPLSLHHPLASQLLPPWPVNWWKKKLHHEPRWSHPPSLISGQATKFQISHCHWGMAPPPLALLPNGHTDWLPKKPTQKPNQKKVEGQTLSVHPK